ACWVRSRVSNHSPSTTPFTPETADRLVVLRPEWRARGKTRRAREKSDLAGRCEALGGLLHERDRVGGALRAIGADMLSKLERRESVGDVHLRDLRRRLVLDDAQHQRDDALGDRGVAVGKEVQPPLA